MENVIKEVRSDPADAKQRLELRTVMNELEGELIARAKVEGWSGGKLVEAYEALAEEEAEREVPTADRLFNTSFPSNKTDPKKRAAWAAAIHAGPRQFKISSELKNVFQPKHMLRLQCILRRLGLAGPDESTVESLENIDARTALARKLLKSVQSKSTYTSTDQIDAKPPVAENTDARIETAVQARVLSLELRDPRIAGLKEKASATPVHSLWANLRVDDFCERSEDLEFLQRFLDLRQEFAWTIVTGDGGEGKTRLAIEFFERLSAGDMQFGFLDKDNFKRLIACAPTKPVFIVVDYAAHVAKEVSLLLRDLVQSNYVSPFQFKVRVLLMERNVEGRWFEELTAPDTLNNSVMKQFFCEPERASSWRLKPLSLESLEKIARDRCKLSTGELSADELIDAIMSVDNRLVEVNGEQQGRPRPFFAAAIGEFISSSDRRVDANKGALKRLRRAEVLDWIVRRERQRVWKRGDVSDAFLEEQRLAQHENLLIIATMVGGLARQDLEKLAPDAKSLLPIGTAFDLDRYARMSGTRSEKAFDALQPDILGDFYALSTLLVRKPDERQILIDAALTVVDSEFYHGRFWHYATDFFDLLLKLDFLIVSPLAPKLVTLKYLAAMTTVGSQVAVVDTVRRREEAIAISGGPDDEHLDMLYARLRLCTAWRARHIAKFATAIRTVMVEEDDTPDVALRLCAYTISRIFQSLSDPYQAEAIEQRFPYEARLLEMGMLCLALGCIHAKRFDLAKDYLTTILERIHETPNEPRRRLWCVAAYLFISIVPADVLEANAAMTKNVDVLILCADNQDKEVRVLLAYTAQALAHHCFVSQAQKLLYFIGDVDRAEKLSSLNSRTQDIWAYETEDVETVRRLIGGCISAIEPCGDLEHFDEDKMMMIVNDLGREV